MYSDYVIVTLLTWERQSGGGSRLFNLHRRDWRPGDSFPEHGHDYFEVFWVDVGSLIHIRDGDEEVLRAGDVVALVPGERHAMRCRDRCAIFNASFSPASIADLHARYGVGFPWPWDGDRAQRRAVLPLAAREQLRGLAALVDRRLPHGRDLLVLGLMHGLAQGHQESLAGLPAEVRRAALTLLDSEDGRPTVAGLARLVGCSREHLSRQVRRWSGRTLAELLRELRLSRAECFLARGRPPAAAAAEAGYSSLSGFYNAFRTSRGLAPGAWRRR